MTEDWADVLVSLVDAGARFLVVGAHALAVHGVPRATRDLDIWVEPSESNAAPNGSPFRQSERVRALPGALKRGLGRGAQTRRDSS